MKPQFESWDIGISWFTILEFHQALVLGKKEYFKVDS
jgi:hypothetical protein